MKKALHYIICGLLLLAMVSCGKGANAIDKAYEEACQAASPEKVATTLCSGDIEVPTLTSEQYAKLGATIGYITYTGMYTANFRAQVDTYKFGKLLRDYRAHVQTPDERLQIDELTKNLLTVDSDQSTVKN